LPIARLAFYAATTLAFVVSARGIFLAPLPLPWAVLGVVLYVTLVLAGVFVLRLRIFVDAVVRGPRAARGVVLTFDDGPDPATTPLVLDALEAAKACATFFVIGKKAEAHPELVREIVRRGHDVGVHSYAHDRLFSLRGEHRVKEDLERAVAVLTKVTGTRPTLFRPPIGHTNPIIARVADALDLTVVGWSVSARDGRAGASRDAVLRRVLAHVDDGSIVLLHDAAERGDHTPIAPALLPELLKQLDDKRLAIVPLSSFLVV
jgi:peptidoglycan/xylan/chitin deacetylase (PgdA/CDA1 family)